MTKIVLGIAVAVLLVGGVAFGLNSLSLQNTDAPDAAQNGDVPGPSSAIYENDYLRISIPPGWTATEATKKIYDKGDVPSVYPNPAAVNIRKGKYILYVNAQASQASGVQGGRFAEIAQGAPSVQAALEDPTTPCNNDTDDHSVIFEYLRHDHYANSFDDKMRCRPPESGSAWYFSYISRGGYFNEYPWLRGEYGGGYVITMAYDSKDVNALPKKGGAELETALREMTDIAKTLVIKDKWKE